MKKYDNQIIEMYNQGLSCQKISDEFKNEFSSTYVRNLLKRNGIMLRKGNKKEVDENFILKKYNDGLSAHQIANLLENVSYTTVLNILKTNNVPIRNKANKEEINIEYISYLYQETKLTLKQIANLTGRTSLESIRLQLIKNNIKRRSRVDHLKFDTSLNDSYFNKIDSEFKAYILGFLITDGSVQLRTNSQPAIRLEIHEKDAYILEYLKSELNSSNQIRISGTGNGCRVRSMLRTFSIHSQEIFHDLTKYGVVPNKTWKTYLPNLDDKSLMRHLIRGLIDGDGWITAKEGNIGLCGNYQLINDVADYLERELGIKKPSIYFKDKESKFCQIIYCRKEYKKILFDYLYEDAKYYLIRKKENLLKNI